MRRAAKRDESERAIVEEWERLGAHSEPVSDKGLPDRLVFYGGRTFLVETKTGARGLTEAQVATFTRLHEAGVRVYVVRTQYEAWLLLARGLQPWTPTQGEARKSKKKQFRPGYDRARTVSEMCRVDGCSTSRAPVSYFCAKHK